MFFYWFRINNKFFFNFISVYILSFSLLFKINILFVLINLVIINIIRFWIFFPFI